MVARLLIGDLNLFRFWPAYQFFCPNLKFLTLHTATKLDALYHVLSQVEEKEQVIVCVLTFVSLEEVNQLEVDSSAFNVCEQVVPRLMGLCPRSPGCQVIVNTLFTRFCKSVFLFHFWSLVLTMGRFGYFDFDPLSSSPTDLASVFLCLVFLVPAGEMHPA